MIEVNGKHNTALCYTDTLEKAALDQIRTVCAYEEFAGCKIRIMPDVHAGKGCTIGTTMTITDKIVPGMVGVDIGCGMETVKIKEREIDFESLDQLIRQEIPSGFENRETSHPLSAEIDLSELRCRSKISIERELLSIGSLGGGNHFIEVDKSGDGDLYIIVHSGSRHLGAKVAALYQNECYRQLCGGTKTQISEVIAEMKAQGRHREIQEAIQRIKEAEYNEIPKELAYATGSLFDDYIHDMRIIQRFANLNRVAMTEVILRGMGLEEVERFTTIHNYIDIDSMILRKGAVSAKKGERLLIPINMRDGSLICVGKGNDDWNQSAPHGAGRLMSRGMASRTLSLDDFRDSMKDVFTTSVSEETLDESPMAYKPIEEIMAQITPTADIIERILPVYNFKAAEQ
jgi:RNA-splicing ligase RtcB